MALCPELSVEAGSGPRSGKTDHRLQQLYLVHAPTLRRFLSQWTGNDHHVTEDLVRETLRRASRALEQADTDPVAMSAWLLTLARRVAMDFTRSRPATGTDGAPRSGDVRSAIGQASDAQIVLALNRLSGEHRAVIAEVFYRGRSVAEAAESLAVDKAIVTVRTYDALRAFRQAIATTLEPGPGI